MNIETLLNDEIESELKLLKDMEIGSDDYKMTVDGLVKLMDRAIEIEKINVEHEEKSSDREADTDVKLAQMEEDKKDRVIKNLIGIAGILIPTAVTIWGTLKSLKFEEEGTVTTIMGRGFINKLLPKK